MLHRNFAVGVIAVPPRRPFEIVAFAASFAAHAAIAALLIWNVGDSERDEEPDLVVDVDLDIAPPAPEGFDPQDPSATTLVDEPAQEEGEAPVEPEPAGATVEPEPQPEPEPEAEEKPAEDEDQSAENSGAADAGPPDQVARAGDAGPPTDGGTEVAASDAPSSPSPFARAAAEIARSGPSLASEPTPPGAKRGADARSIALPPGASADLRTYAPQSDKIAVLLRYDRLRGTPWAALADAIVAPMPDYRSIVGDRKVALADMFQSLLISTRNPTNPIATNLVARTHLSPAEIRRFLNHPAQPVSWQLARGGMLGTRGDSELKHERDRRVYLMPLPGMVVLTAPRHLGVLVEPGPAPSNVPSNATGTAPGTDSPRAADSDLPGWLSRARSVDNEAGVDSDVIAVVTVGGLRRDEIAVPELGSVPTPVRFSLALEMAKVGFYVRGTLAFATPELARQFEVQVNQGRKQMLGNRFTQLMLRNLHALHALEGLTLRRRGQLVTYATSISNADAKAGMRLAADWARRFFETPPEENPSPGATPGNGAPNGAAPGAAAPGNAVPGNTPPSSGSTAPGGAASGSGASVPGAAPKGRAAPNDSAPRR
jgi:hypothetical protein